MDSILTWCFSKKQIRRIIDSTRCLLRCRAREQWADIYWLQTQRRIFKTYLNHLFVIFDELNNQGNSKLLILLVNTKKSLLASTSKATLLAMRMSWIRRQTSSEWWQEAFWAHCAPNIARTATNATNSV